MPIRRETIPPPSVDDFVAREGLTLIEVWVSWSGDAFLIGAAIDRLLRSGTLLSLRVGRVDADTHPEICERYHAVPPALLLFRDGELVGSQDRLITKDGLTEWLTAAADARPPNSANTEDRND